MTRSPFVRQTAEDTVKRIVDDMTDRSGLDNEWSMIDEETRRGIIQTWRDFVADALEHAMGVASPY